MDFELNEEQRLLQDSVQRLLADRYSFEQRKAHGKHPEGWSREIWAAYAELGLLGLPFSEEDGGFGGTAVETMLVSEAMGAALTLEPYFATVTLGGGFLRHGADAALRAELIPQVAEGSLTMAFAYTEPQSRYDLGDVATTARKNGNEWVLEGRKGVVLHGDTADKLFVTARVSGDRRGRKGVGVFLVDGKASGLHRRGFPTYDGRRAAEIQFAGVRAQAVLGDPENGLPLALRVADEGIAALAAEAVGAMDAAQKLTLDYLKTRKQFGVTIGSFQAIQHRAADVMVALEEARSMAMYGAMMVAETDAAERSKAMSAVKIQIGRSAKLQGEESIQMHGGIGMTDEYSVGHYFKRLTAIEHMFGDADRHVALLSATDGLVA